MLVDKASAPRAAVNLLQQNDVGRMLVDHGGDLLYRSRDQRGCHVDIAAAVVKELRTRCEGAKDGGCGPDGRGQYRFAWRAVGLK